MAANNNNSKIWQDSVAATKDCPAIEVLDQVMEGTAQDANVQQHVSSCAHCQTELAMLRQFEHGEPSADEGAAVAWIAAQLERNQNKTAAKPVRQAIPFWRSLFRVPYMAATAAVILAGVLGVSVFVNESGKPPLGPSTYEGPVRSGAIHLTDPVGDQTKAPDKLEWEAYKGANSYSITISGIDIDHTVVWKGQSNENSLAIGPELKSKIRPGKPLTWKVTALDSTGKELASGEGRFRLALTQQTK